MSRYRTVLLAGLTAGAMLIPTTGASAGTIEVVNGTAVFTASPGEANDIRAGSIAAPDTVSLKVIDNGAPLTAGSGCQQLDASSAWCPENAGPFSGALPLTVLAGDRDDTVLVDDFNSREVTVRAGRGDDSVHVGNSVGTSPVLRGGRGDDELTTMNNGNGTPILRGGRGDDVITIGEQGGGHAFGGAGNDDLRFFATFFGIEDVALDGGIGNDTYTFEASQIVPGAMVPTPGLDTLDQRDSGPFGTLNFDMSTCPGCVERVIGTPRGDHITGDNRPQAILGDAGNDSLDGGGGSDVISGQANDDTIMAQDGVFDIVGCDGGTDSVTADRFDLVSGSCENVSRARASRARAG
jgi:Ca2+-binding RTX toxin-like protein